MRKWLIIAPLGLIFACGNGDTEIDEVLVLDDFEDRMGYVLGSLNAESIMQSGEQMNNLNKDLLIEGFNENFNDKECIECDKVLMDLFGPYFQDFDTAFVAAGSKCLGRKTGFAFYADMVRMGGLDNLDLEMVKAGFKHGVHDTDTLIDETERRTMVQNFITDLNVLNGDKMMANAKDIEGVQVFENGIVMLTIEEGNGSYPGPTDDVEVEYILTSSLGDTIQSSYQMKEMSGSSDPVALSLNGGVIPGWSYVLPKMKKGGTYRIYVPWELAYGEQGGKESLCFLIELIKYGPQGTLLKEQPPIPGGI